MSACYSKAGDVNVTSTAPTTSSPERMGEAMEKAESRDLHIRYVKFVSTGWDVHQLFTELSKKTKKNQNNSLSKRTNSDENQGSLL